MPDEFGNETPEERKARLLAAAPEILGLAEQVPEPGTQPDAISGGGLPDGFTPIDPITSYPEQPVDPYPEGYTQPVEQQPQAAEEIPEQLTYREGTAEKFQQGALIQPEEFQSPLDRIEVGRELGRDLAAEKVKKEIDLAEEKQHLLDTRQNTVSKFTAIQQRKINDLVNSEDRSWWDDRSTGGKIAGILAAFMGGLVAPYQGGRNLALEQINLMIDRDAQKKATARRQKISAAKEEFTTGLALIDDQTKSEFAKLQAQAVGWGKTQNEIAMMINKLGDTDAKEAALAAYEQAGFKRAEAELNMRMLGEKVIGQRLDNMAKERKLARQGAGGGFGSATSGAEFAEGTLRGNSLIYDTTSTRIFDAADPKSIQEMERIGLEPGRIPTETFRRGIGVKLRDGRFVTQFRVPADERKVLNDAVVGRDKARQATQNLLRVLDKIEKQNGGLGDWADKKLVDVLGGIPGKSGSELRKELDAAVNAVVNIYKEAKNFGAALTETEVGFLLGELFGVDPRKALASLSYSDMRTKMGQSQDRLDAELKNNVGKALGFHPDAIELFDVDLVAPLREGDKAAETPDAVTADEYKARIQTRPEEDDPPEVKKELAKDRLSAVREIYDDVVRQWEGGTAKERAEKGVPSPSVNTQSAQRLLGEAAKDPDPEVSELAKALKKAIPDALKKMEEFRKDYESGEKQRTEKLQQSSGVNKPVMY